MPHHRTDKVNREQGPVPAVALEGALARARDLVVQVAAGEAPPAFREACRAQRVSLGAVLGVLGKLLRRGLVDGWEGYYKDLVDEHHSYAVVRRAMKVLRLELVDGAPNPPGRDDHGRFIPRAKAVFALLLPHWCSSRWWRRRKKPANDLLPPSAHGGALTRPVSASLSGFLPTDAQNLEGTIPKRPVDSQHRALPPDYIAARDVLSTRPRH